MSNVISRYFFLVLYFVVMGGIYAQLPAGIQIDKGKKLQQENRFTESNKQYLLAIDILRGKNEYCKIFEIHVEVAYNLLDLQENGQAISHIETAIQDFDTSTCQDTTKLIRLLTAQHDILANSGEIKSSFPPLERAKLLTIESLGINSKMMVSIHRYYAAYYGDKGGNYLAIEEAEKSLKLARKYYKSNDDSYVTSMYALANFLERIGDYENSYKYLDSIVNLIPQTHRRAAPTYHMLSLLSLRQGEYSVSKKYAELALHIYDEKYGKGSRESSFPYQELGSALLNLGEVDDAMKSYHQAYTIRQKFYGPHHRLTLSSLSSLSKSQMAAGDTLSSINNYKSVVADFAREYQLDKADKYILNTIKIGDYYLAAGIQDSAQAYFKKAYGLSSKYYEVGDRTNIQSCLSLAKVGRYEDREAYVKGAIYHLTGDSLVQHLDRTKITFAPSKRSILEVLLIHADNLMTRYVEEGNDRFLLELISYEPLIKLLKEEVFYQFVSPKSITRAAPAIRAFALLILKSNAILFKQTKEIKYLESALHAMDQSKDLDLQVRLFERNLKELIGLPDSIVNEERQLFLKINELNIQLGNIESDSISTEKLKLEQSYFDLRRKNKLTFRKYNDILNQDRFSVESIREQLDNRTAILNYFLDKDELYVLFLGKKEAGIYSTPFGVDQVDSLQQYISYVSELNVSTTWNKWNIGHALFKTLIPGELPERISKLYVIPDNELAVLPFDVLLTENIGAHHGLTQLPFLIKKFETSYLSGLSYTNNRDSKKDVSDVIAFAPFTAGTDANITGMPLLRYSEEEIDAIADVFELNQFKDQDATEAQMKLLVSDYDVLHIASHAMIDGTSPLRSNILFYPSDSSEDGRLELWELYTMEVPAELAVLSACQTADGTLLNGTGLVNVARGFYTAGTKSVISNLWPVQDFAASKLMKPFYEAFKVSKNASSALREAKLYYISNQIGPLAHPMYWAGWMIQSNTMDNPKSSILWIWIVAAIGLVSLYILYRSKGARNSIISDIKKES